MQLASVVQQQPQCLCSEVNGGSQLGISMNQTLAMSLPRACANGVESSVSSTYSSDETPDSSTTPTMPSSPSGTLKISSWT
ncbi:hypothetical protein Patl1_03339 [Pistacia atlantica]|uniref:Uncharacterized protein n=1 Tax=Pistacia atlantica TaxID=434234 RepID=A0ACC1C870_9ROSI|nr:hypothetical protein Patl1_03339 [Pistacia atlantica]